MKRVRYLAGVAGLAPMAMGMATGPFAQAATTAGQTGSARTASTRHARMGAGTSSPGSPNTGCRGSLEFWIPKNGNVKGHGWWRAVEASPLEMGCIGTVAVSTYFNKNICKSVALVIRGCEASRRVYGPTKLCGYDQWRHHSYPVHQTFISPIQLCISSTYGKAPYCHIA
jgi:hypothetical protein